MQPGDAHMPGVGPGVLQSLFHVHALFPVPDPCLFTGHELIKIHRGEFVPDAALAPVVRDPAFRGNAGSGEHDHAAGGCDFFGNGPGFGLDVRGQGRGGVFCHDSSLLAVFS
jgi:hypothetical protein